MEWFTLVSTAVGVILGVGATNFNERVKWKRDRKKALYESRSKLYADLLADLTKTRAAIRVAARSTTLTPEGKCEAVNAAFASANVYASRYQVQITSPEHVADAGAAAVRALSVVRDSIIAGDRGTDAYRKLVDEFEAAMRHLISIMREDLSKIA